MSGGLKKVVFFILLLGLTYLAYKYMIKPANNKLAVKKSKVEVKLAKLAEFERTAAAGEGLSKQLEQLEEAIQFFESKLPPTSEIDKVLQDITAIGEKNGVNRRTIFRLEQKHNSGYIEQPLKMELEGNFNSFYAFLLELEKLPRIMKIRELRLKKEANDEGRIAANYVVSIFFQNKES